ncbi:hypothetical protein [Streptosporangium sandarakinum]|uniref:hypothetical protein n=1 Tax=Streptosporangium sandarakinum TaxID=1260955 RepID=UPI00343D7675
MRDERRAPEVTYGMRLEQAIEELAHCGDIEVERRPPAPGLTPQRLELLADADRVFDRIADEWRVRLDDALRPYHFAADEYHAAWGTSDGSVLGEFCLRNIYDCLVGRRHPVLGDENLPSKDRGVLAALRIFDEAPFAGAGAVAGLRVPSGSGELEIWFYVATQAMFHRLHLDYGTYLETLLLTKGAFGWQYLFADVDLSGPQHHDTAEILTAMLDVFPRYFPGHDYNPLRVRLRERL